MYLIFNLINKKIHCEGLPMKNIANSENSESDEQKQCLDQKGYSTFWKSKSLRLFFSSRQPHSIHHKCISFCTDSIGDKLTSSIKLNGIYVLK